jgi:hypothetical protein
MTFSWKLTLIQEPLHTEAPSIQISKLLPSPSDVATAIQILTIPFAKI